MKNSAIVLFICIALVLGYVGIINWHNAQPHDYYPLTGTVIDYNTIEDINGNVWIACNSSLKIGDHVTMMMDGRYTEQVEDDIIDTIFVYDVIEKNLKNF